MNPKRGFIKTRFEGESAAIAPWAAHWWVTAEFLFIFLWYRLTITILFCLPFFLKHCLVAYPYRQHVQSQRWYYSAIYITHIVHIQSACRWICVGPSLKTHISSKWWSDTLSMVLKSYRFNLFNTLLFECNKSI